MSDRYDSDPKAVNESRTRSENSLSDYPLMARQLVANFLYPSIPIGETYVVWFSKTLGNWKALVSTTTEDNLYYEVTHNGAKGETYLDIYRKINNVCIPDKETNE